MILKATPEASRLMHEGAIVLARIEHNGIRVDVPKLKKTQDEIRERIRVNERQLKADPLWQLWQRRFGARAVLGSEKQLADLVFGELGYKSKGQTATGQWKSDNTAFEFVDLPFVKLYSETKKLRKLEGTFLAGIERETTEGFLHPFFNLHTTKTYRGSSDSINFQNFPVRDEYGSMVIRSTFIARGRKRHIVEVDFSGIEVKIAYTYHRDPTMLKYLTDAKNDMHRDMAIQCYKLRPEQITKKLRYCAKNMFVFPQFYGDYYVQCAANLWDAIGRMNLETADGIPLRDHLKSVGIKKRGSCTPGEPTQPGTFEAHLKEVEKDFWERRFRVYGQWRKNVWDEYQRTCQAQMHTGFVVGGLADRNDVINYRVQGAAFHCLLWSLIRLQRYIDENEMRSLLVGQIHDSIVADVPDDELQDFLTAARHIMTRTLPKAWRWISVPLEVEVDVAPCGGSWFDKAPWLERNGIWIPKPKDE